MTKINRIFSKEKELSLDLYLEKVLYDKNIGYYQKKIHLELRAITLLHQIFLIFFQK